MVGSGSNPSVYGPTCAVTRESMVTWSSGLTFPCAARSQRDSPNSRTSSVPGSLLHTISVGGFSYHSLPTLPAAFIHGCSM